MRSLDICEIFGHKIDRVISTREGLRSVYKEPSKFVSNKVIDHIDALAERFIARCSLAFLATCRKDGEIDLTPRGDPAGFLKVLERHTIALPDRPGNNRADAFENIIENPKVGLICVIPGYKDTIRISGQAALVQDNSLGEMMAIQGKPAKLLLLIKVTRLLCHCPKAFIRSSAWEPDKWPDTSDVPSLAEMMIAHGEIPIEKDAMETIIQEDGKNRLY